MRVNNLNVSRLHGSTGPSLTAVRASERSGMRVIAAATPSGGRRRGDGGRSRQSGDSSSNNSKKGRNFEKKSRRKGRPEWLRSPDDSPLRDGNRDRLIGFVTLRAARTLSYYLSETTPVVHQWLNQYIHEHPIPRDGSWDDISGDTFLRGLLKTPPELATGNWGRPSMYSSGRGASVDPRQIAQRIMEIRSQLAKEMMQDLGGMQEENNTLMRETLLNSFSLSLEHVVAHPVENAETPVTESSLQSKESPEILTESRLEDEKSEEISKEKIEEKMFQQRQMKMIQPQHKMSQQTQRMMLKTRHKY